MHLRARLILSHIARSEKRKLDRSFCSSLQNGGTQEHRDQLKTIFSYLLSFGRVQDFHQTNPSILNLEYENS